MMQLVQSFKGQDSQMAVQLLQPDIKIIFKEKLAPESLPNDVVFHIRQNFSQDEQVPMSKFVAGFFKHLIILNQPTTKTSQREIYQAFQDCMEGGFLKVIEFPFFDAAWAGQVVDHMIKLFVSYAIAADNEANSQKDIIKGEDADAHTQSGHVRLEKIVGSLMDLFRRIQQTANNPAPDNRLFIAFFIAVRAIKVLLRLNNFKNSSSYFKWIEMQFDPNKASFYETQFPMNWRVMLAYLKGRQSIYDNDYAKAREELRFAFSYNHPENPRNKKKILKFLVLVEINLNVFPTKALLTKYQLTEYIELVDACQTGDLKRFEESLNKHMDNFIYGGVYLLAEKLRHLTLRNLMKKVALVIQKDKTLQVSETQPHLIKLEIVHNILK